MMKFKISTVSLILFMITQITHAEDSNVVKVAIAQIQCIDSDRSGNLVRIEYAIADAVDRGSQIICFPETSIYGWVNPDAHLRAEPIPGKDFEALSGFAKQYKVYVSIGLVEKVGDRLYDSAVLIDDHGTLLLKHRKINTLEHLMSPPYTPGQAVETVETKFGRIGILICADTFDSSVIEQMRARRPELLLVPYGWAANKEDWPKHGLSLKSTIESAAKKIGCPIVGTNLVGSISQGPWIGMVYGGQSYALDQSGTVIARGKDRDRDIIVFSVAPISAQQ